MKAGWRILCGCSFLAASFLAGSCSRQASGIRPKDDASHIVLFYRDPMHPSYKSDKPGTAPDCGMTLEPVYATARIAGEPTGAIRIAPERQKIIGITLGRVDKGPVTMTLRTLGRVAVDESRVFPVNAGADGVVTKVFSVSTDTPVRKGQPLAAIYGREFITAQRTFLYSLRATTSAVPATAGLDYQDQPAFSMEESRLNLFAMGFGEAQLEQIRHERRPLLDVIVVAPAAGTILSRSAFASQRFSRGTELFRIADLNRVWIVADLNGESDYVRYSSVAKVSISNRPDHVYPATISSAQPHFDAATRTLKVRLEMDNPGGSLRPDMFVDVAFSVNFPESITVPADAIVDSGLRKTVFVNHNNGEFEPRPVETGWRAGDRVQVLRGLEPGESIVTSGNFLLDSETRIRALATDSNRHD